MPRILILALLATLTTWAEKPSFTVGWSIYAGWTPYHYLLKSGILRKWADKYGIEIKVRRFDYAPSLDAFVARNIDACTMTNMEALDMPAASGVATTVVLIGDYSNGNDALLARSGTALKDLPGKKLPSASWVSCLRYPCRRSPCFRRRFRSSPASPRQSPPGISRPASWPARRCRLS